MTAAPGELSSVQLCRAQVALRQRVVTLLAGSGLRIRELAHGLVIFNPRDRDSGQVHIAYADGYVSWSRMTWNYWGNLQGYEDETDGIGSGVAAEKILGTLGGKTGGPR